MTLMSWRMRVLHSRMMPPMEPVASTRVLSDLETAHVRSGKVLVPFETFLVILGLLRHRLAQNIRDFVLVLLYGPFQGGLAVIVLDVAVALPSPPRK